MYQQRNGRQIMIIGGGVIILVLLAAFFLTRSSGTKSASSVPMSKVVVALESIPQGTTLTPTSPLDQFFTTKDVPKSIIPFGAYTSTKEITSLIRSVSCQPRKQPGCSGQITVTQTIYQNLPVVSGMFTTLGQYRTAAGPAFQVPYGYVAIAISFSSTNSVVGSIQPGDDIDIIASLTGMENNSGSTKVPSQTQYVMNDVRVIGVNGPPATPGTGNGNNAAQGGGTLVVLARYQEALVIQHLKDFGGSWQLSAVLRSSKETDIPHFKTLPVTGRWFFVKQSNHFDFTNPY